MHRGGRQAGGTGKTRARRFRPARQAQPMNLSDHGVPGHAVAEQARDLARAFAVNPMLLELFDYLVRPSHLSPRSSNPRQRRRNTQNPTPSPGEEPAGPNADQHSIWNPPHDISWASRRKLHYSLNHAQESSGVAQGAFPQLFAFRIVVLKWGPSMPESDQRVSVSPSGDDGEPPF